ncbi:hypothetical protein HIM_10277 [Hirsutella minnesotensis 3608]|uniref:GPI inositol-deacylase n=1 Tax=Hirsutella minnesotensis 3608 TaxID=1043627 RepID=A0A0F7ZRX0_9HYPO|nr:hypothetical protein HIM_10277 [Hirsutella minnesotensis 3608]
MDHTTAVYLLVSLLSIAFLYDQVTKRIPTRLVAGQAPKSRFGLVPIGAHNLPTRAGGVDIVFVHGLGSNPDTTWQARRPAMTPVPLDTTLSDSEQYVNWVSDFLPNDLPPAIRGNVRIFFYNYDSYWKRDAVYTRLPNLGSDLLERIGQVRLSDEERQRDLIFVGHSYGGLVVKQALVHARTNRAISHVAEHTKAILFLGTPHRGSSFGLWGWLAAQVLQPLGSNPFILANLEYDSISLLDLHKAFVGIVRDDFQVFNFFEQRPMRIFRLWFIQWQQFCVREQSATYDGRGVSNIGLSVDHYGLNKFGSRNDNYDTILSRLVKITISSARPLKHHYVVPVETVPSYTQRDELWKELEEKLNIRHGKASVPRAVAIHGLGGAGKSQLALKYAESKRDRYNPILWIDATNKETVRSSFERCASELGLSGSGNEEQKSALADARTVLTVLRWLRDRTEADDEWLVIIDNADDFSWGIMNVIPKGERGSVIITSQDDQSRKLIPAGCEEIQVDVMSRPEAATLLLHHLGLDIDVAPENIRRGSEEVVQELGNLALAIDLAGAYLAGAYIGNDPTPEQALMQYLEDYKVHRDELLQMDMFRGLRPTEKTVWTVWDTTLRKIARDHTHLEPGLLLTFLAHFKGTIVQDEMFRLAALGARLLDNGLVDEIPTYLRQFFQGNEGKWDSFLYRQSRELLVRYSLLHRVAGTWAGVTMHKLVQWRTLRSEQGERWQWWYMLFILAACRQVTKEEHQPEFRRHLTVHLPDICGVCGNVGGDAEGHESFIGTTLARVYYDEGRWEEAAKLFVQAMETSKTKLGADHPDTLTIMANLALTFSNQGLWEKAEKLFVQVIETSKTKLGADHPDTLTSMGNLALTFLNQGRWEEAEKLFVQVMETRKTKLGADHPDTLTIMANLASTFLNQGRWEEAENLAVQVLETRKTKLGADHPSTLTSMANLASTYRDQGLWEGAEKLEAQVMKTRKMKLGADHPDTLTSMANLASTFSNRGRWEEAEKLFVRVIETSKSKLGADHPSTLSSMANLASTYRGQGLWEKAEKLFVQVTETSKTKLGADHPSTLTSVANLASTFCNQGRWEEAEKLFVQAMQTSKTKLGADHPSTLTIMANLASTYRAQGRWEKAEKLFMQVIEASKSKLGADHPSTLTIMANLASTYRARGRWEKAEKLFMQVIEASKSKLGADHPSTLASMANLASTFSNQGRWEVAEKLEAQVMKARKAKLGADHPDTLTSMANLASTFSTQGRWEEAEKLEAQVMKARKAKLGADHPATLASMANLASTFSTQGRWEEAEKLEAQVMKARKAKLGADHPATLASMANLASTFSTQGRWEEAEKLEAQVMKARKAKLGADHPATLASMANLASTFSTQGRWEEAEKLEAQVMKARKAKLGADHPATLASMANLASTFSTQGRWEEAEKLEAQVMKARKAKLGADHPATLASMANLASTFSTQGRWEEAEKLEVQVLETRKTKLGADHPDTLTSMANLAFTWKYQGRRADALVLMGSCVQALQRVLGPEHPHTQSCVAALDEWST